MLATLVPSMKTSAIPALNWRRPIQRIVDPEKRSSAEADGRA